MVTDDPPKTAIETAYAGCRFRSRLEARWAILFDHLRIEWQYEPQGFVLGAEAYLPDFYLPRTETWVEVRGVETQGGLERLANFVDFGGPLPGVTESWEPECRHCGSWQSTTRGLLLLGDIPFVSGLTEGRQNPGMPMWSMLQHHKGVWKSRARLVPWGLQVFPDPWQGSTTAPDVPVGTSFKNSWNYPFLPSDKWQWIVDAHTAARSARFEHGEQPERPSFWGRH
jgi:hypothetical protein